MKWYGQGAIDSVIDRFFQKKDIQQGTFLDVGTLDGMRFSNTYSLEKERGWTGICIEVHPSYKKWIKKNRPNSTFYSCAASNIDHGEQVANLNWRGSLSSLDLDKEGYFRANYDSSYGDRSRKEIDGFLNGLHIVKTRTLNSILEEQKEKFPTINFVTVDIDGSELMALPHLDLSKIQPDMLCLEWSVVGHEYINNYAAQYGFFPAKQISADVLFVQEHDLELATSLDTDLLCNWTVTEHPCDA